MECRVTFAISPSLEDALARKILLADDSVTAQNMGRKILSDAGYDVTTVNNGSAALKKIGELRPDLIVLDVYMPGYSGLEVCQRLKDAGETAKIPVLLTVGKLEPFKPEEAKRVRADGFIVKPFEASELLSAMSKLEDKVVPAPEMPKPGRFARVAAAIEQQSSKTAPTEEDSGWKKRIAFPSQKPEKTTKAEEADANDSGVYNPVNRDLRTTIDSKPAEKVPAAQAGHDRVDVGALATAGLPADVTSEEIAALAAAAAQVKSKIEERIAEDKTTESWTPDGRIAEEKIAEEQIAEEQITEAKITEAKIAEVKTEEAPAEPAVVSAQPETWQAESKPEFKPELTDEKPVATEPELATAVAGPAEQAEKKPEPVSFGVDSARAWDSPAPESDEPVTMAVATVSVPCAGASRWTAVAVAPDLEEAAASLEQEMQRAHAAVATEEHAPTATVSQTSTPEALPALPPADATGEKVDLTSLTAEAPGAVPSFAQAATEAVSGAVEKLEAVADAQIEQPTPAPVEAASPEHSELATSPAAESAQTIETSEEKPPAVAITPALAITEVKSEQEATVENQPPQESERELQEKDWQEKDQSEKDRQESYPAPAMPVAEVSAAATDFSAAPDSASEAQTVSASNEASKGEADIDATTAAAWASWRRIRESGDAKPQPEAESSKPGQEMPVTQDAAAMAVAAGAEKPPEPASEHEPAQEELASIVDGILADMRPKILEEVSRKLRHKQP